MKCSGCLKNYDLIDMAYIGPEDASDTRCCVHMVFVYLCEDCYNKELDSRTPKKVRKIKNLQ